MVDRDYPGDGIVVQWDSEVCMHSGNCARALSRVFRPTHRPWIDTSAASAEEIIAAIETCPSGALDYTRTPAPTPASAPAPTPALGLATAAPQAESQPTVVITVGADGPYQIRGPVEIRDAMGNVISSVKRAALCRCGNSGNKPFCDDTHKRIGFTAE